eukprot:jgi/Phyca11/118770/e_gw1.36.105.1
MDHGDAPAAAQISQADIIERQAETIAKLQRQVKRGSEYKQLTKSKLKEAAARLKEYRIRVETLLRAEETLKKQLKDEEKAHARTKKQNKTPVVKATKPTQSVSTQTEEARKVTRTSQTVLSGHVERVNKKTIVDCGVQTVDTLVSKKRARGVIASTQTEMDQFVPRLSRHPQVGGHQEDITSMSEQQPLQLLGPEPLPHETSAALDAALAFSDSDGDSEDTLEIDGATESKETGEGSTLIAFDAAMSSEIDKELEFSDEEEDVSERKTEAVAVPSGLKTNSELESPETGRRRTEAASAVVDEPESGFDAISNEIDKELETSSDEEDDRKATTDDKEAVDEARVDVDKGKRTIDDELDDEFAALESDSEPDNHGKEPANGEGSSSSDSDSSDSSDSESDEDNGSVEKPLDPVAKETAESTLQNSKDEAPSDSTPVVLTTPTEKKSVTVAEAVYSPVVAVELPAPTPEVLQLEESNPVEEASAAETNCVNPLRASEQSDLPTPSKADQPIELTTYSTSEPSDTVIPDELPNAEAEPTPEIQANINKSLKKTRKAEEASLDDCQIPSKKHLGDSLAENKPVSTQMTNVAHEIVFLAHITGLHTHLCQSTGQLSRSRVLLFDILRGNPNIRGLYFTMVMVEVYPALLEREFDQHCVERQQILKETIQQALVAISSVAASREELLLLQSSLTMLHQIADAIQMPELESIDATDPKMYVEKLFDRLRAQNVDLLELTKSLELCVAVYGLDVVAQVFSVEKCQELFATGSCQGKSGVLAAVGCIAASTGNAPTAQQNVYVENVLAWLHRILSNESTGLKLRVKCSSVCIELILASCASEGLESRRRVLCAVVKWFDATPMDELVEMPTTFLRRLRLAVVASRPPAIKTRQ